MHNQPLGEPPPGIWLRLDGGLPASLCLMLENQQPGRMLDIFVDARIPDVSGDASAG